MSNPLPPGSGDSLFQTLDRVLRGGFLRSDSLSGGLLDLPVRRLLVLGAVLGVVYGVCLGGYSLFRGADHAWLQTVASACKVPMLFLLTLLVTFPSLYVFAALQQLPLDFGGTLRLLLLAILVHLAVLASLGPVFAFFAASTNSYSFLLLLNVAFFVVGGLLGFMVLRRATRGMFAPPKRANAAWPAGPSPVGSADQPPAEAPVAAGQESRPADHARRVLGVWCFVYGVVGAQMGWLLRPFLGAPEQPFAWFRPREDNFFAVVLRTLGDLFGR